MNDHLITFQMNDDIILRFAMIMIDLITACFVAISSTKFVAFNVTNICEKKGEKQIKESEKM